MQELEWIQLLMILQLLILKMEHLKLEKIHWLNSKRENQNLILNNMMQIEMAAIVIDMCDKKIKYFEGIEAAEAKRKPKVKEPKSE